jgi:hypothetical protein
MVVAFSGPWCRYYSITYRATSKIKLHIDLAVEDLIQTALIASNIIN